MMTELLIGCGQITWRGLPEEQVLAEIAQAGYAGAPAGPRVGRTARETVDLYARYGLRPAPGYYGADFWRAEQRAEILEQARRQADFARELGLTELYVAAGGFTTYLNAAEQNRKQIAARVGPGDGMTDDEFKRFADALGEFGALTLREGVRSCFHNHVGSVIESNAEIERLLALTDPAVVFLGPDTGHLAWAGVEPVAFCRRHLERIKTLHVKDIDAAVLERGRAQGWDYDTFERNGIFAELGQGCVDFAVLFDLLRASGFAGWAIAETDTTQRPTALESATISRGYLRTLGL
jgi:inosose dehydratase